MSSDHLSLEALKKLNGRPIASHMDSTFRLLLDCPQAVVHESYMQLITGEPHPFGNYAVLRESGDVYGIKAAVPGLVDSGAPSAVILLSDASNDVANHLTESGFSLEEVMPGMAIKLEELASTELPDGYEFVRVDGEQLRNQWVQCASIGYGVPVPVTELFTAWKGEIANAADDAQIQMFAISKGGELVATSMMVLNDGLAGIYWVATLTEERGKGLGAHVTAEPLRRAKELGSSTGILQASTAGFSVYQRLGFEQLCGLPLYARMP